MTKQEIIELCISAYSEAIEVCKELELNDAKGWLRDKRLHLGVCLYTERVLSEGIMYKYWVSRHGDESCYWTITPSDCRTDAELIKALTTRLNILKRELEIPE